MYSRKPDIRVRDVAAESAALLTGIHRHCFTSYWNVDSFNDFFSVAGTRALLAELPEDGELKPVGMMVYRLHHEQADIITVCILPPWRRHGIARLLLQEAISRVAEAGVEQMFLDVEDGNRAAIGLYQGFGFTQINRRKLYYRQKDGSFTDALVMTCKLA